MLVAVWPALTRAEEKVSYILLLIAILSFPLSNVTTSWAVTLLVPHTISFDTSNA